MVINDMITSTSMFPHEIIQHYTWEFVSTCKAEADGTGGPDDSLDQFGEGQVVTMGTVSAEFNSWSLTCSSMEPKIP